MKKFGDYAAGPREARPLSWDELTGHERGLLRDLHARLDDICRVAREPRELHRPDDPWVQIEHDPRGRVMLITGPRGSGKTTLLVTLLAQLRQAGPETRVRAGSNRMPRGVRALPILDFDPLPPGLSLHAWLVQAWLPLVDYLEQRTVNTAPDAVSADDVFPRSELYALWDKLLERAVVGWAGVHDGRPMGEKLFDHREQLDGYRQLSADWRRFVDHIFARLDQTEDHGVDVILVPLDDLDLQVRRNSELLHATRLLRHPRVVYLITGDRDHASHVVALDYRRQHLFHAESAATDRGTQALLDTVERDSEALARALLEKSFPATHTFRTSPLSITLVLSAGNKALHKALNAMDVGGQPVGDWLVERAKGTTGSDEKFMHWRAVQRVIDELAVHERKKSPLPNATRALASILSHGAAEKHVAALLLPRHGSVIDFSLAGELRVSALPAWFVGSPNRRITVGTELTTVFTAPTGQQLDAPTALLARELHEAAEDPITGAQKSGTGRRGPVQADRIVLAIDSVLVWTRWTNAPRNALFFWPFALFPKIPMLRIWLRQWDQLAGEIRDVKNPDERLAYAWIHCQLEWGGFRPPRLPRWHDQISSESWQKLWQAVKRAAASDKNFGYWYQHSLPLFAMPEFGLPEDVQERILSAVAPSRKSGKFSSWVSTIDPSPDDRLLPGGTGRGERHQCVMNALYAARRDAGEGDEPNDEDGAALLREAQKIAPDAPWYRMTGRSSRLGL